MALSVTITSTPTPVSGVVSMNITGEKLQTLENEVGFGYPAPSTVTFTASSSGGSASFNGHVYYAYKWYFAVDKDSHNNYIWHRYTGQSDSSADVSAGDSNSIFIPISQFQSVISAYNSSGVPTYSGGIAFMAEVVDGVGNTAQSNVISVSITG